MHLLLCVLVALSTATATPDDPADEGPEEAEAATAPPASPDIVYTRELTDEDLARKFRDDLPALGSVAVGFADRGRLLNGVQMPRDPAWILERPNLAFGTRETVDALALAFRAVRREFPDSAPGRVSHMAAGRRLPAPAPIAPERARRGHRLLLQERPHPARGAARERLMDPARNWALLHALITETDVQMILVDRRIQAVLRKYALSIGEDAAGSRRCSAGS